MIYLYRFRPFGIKDIALARLARPFNGIGKEPTSVSSKQFTNLIKPFETTNYVIDVAPKDEMALVKSLIKTHPEFAKPFSHFLIDPPLNITPSQLYDELHNRTDMIPTLCAVTIIDGEIREIERINTHHELFKKLHAAHERGWIPTSICKDLLGSSRVGKAND